MSCFCKAKLGNRIALFVDERIPELTNLISALMPFRWNPASGCQGGKQVASARMRDSPERPAPDVPQTLFEFGEKADDICCFEVRMQMKKVFVFE